MKLVITFMILPNLFLISTTLSPSGVRYDAQNLNFLTFLISSFPILIVLIFFIITQYKARGSLKIGFYWIRLLNGCKRRRFEVHIKRIQQIDNGWPKILSRLHSDSFSLKTVTFPQLMVLREKLSEWNYLLTNGILREWGWINPVYTTWQILAVKPELLELRNIVC